MLIRYSFKGQERDFVILSCVRASANGSVVIRFIGIFRWVLGLLGLLGSVMNGTAVSSSCSVFVLLLDHFQLEHFCLCLSHRFSYHSLCLLFFAYFSYTKGFLKDPERINVALTVSQKVDFFSFH